MTTTPIRHTPLLALIALGLSFAAGCSSPSPDSLCDRTLARARRCNPSMPACEATDLRNACVRGTQLFRSEYVTAADPCVTESAACGSAGDMEVNACITAQVSTLTLTQAHRDLINALCMRCPQFGGASDAAACVTAVTTPPASGGDAGAGSALYSTFVTLSDSTANQIRACVDASGTDPMMACTSFSRCLLSVTQGASGDAGSSCPSTSVQTAHCARMDAPGLAICQEYSGFATAQESTFRDQCTMGSSPGTWSQGECTRTNSIGGCRASVGTIRVTTWYYTGTLTQAQVEQTCTSAGQTFVAP